jgi:hypothetical protein
MVIAIMLYAQVIKTNYDALKLCARNLHWLLLN